MKQFECSVIVIQYNPVWEKCRATLESVINQEDCTFEVIVADDGSKDKNMDQLKSFFAEKHFSEYKIVDNQVNQGTVANVLSGVRAASGKYVRVIAPGDLLYSERTLRQIVDFMDLHEAKEAFGKMVFYNHDGNDVELIAQQVPFNCRPYQTNNRKSMYRHLLDLGDNISGASYTWDRLFYMECLESIVGKVKYVEDCVNVRTLCTGQNIYFLDEFVTWYEYGTGISTNKSTVWNQRIINDWCAFLREMRAQYPEKKGIKRALQYYEMCKKTDFFSKVLKTILFFDRFFYGRIVSQFLMDRDYSSVDKEKLLKNF